VPTLRSTRAGTSGPQEFPDDRKYLQLRSGICRLPGKRHCGFDRMVAKWPPTGAAIILSRTGAAGNGPAQRDLAAANRSRYDRRKPKFTVG
jgi:hypothetical protein